MGLEVEERETNGDPMEKRKQVETERMLLAKEKRKDRRMVEKYAALFVTLIGNRKQYRQP